MDHADPRTPDEWHEVGSARKSDAAALSEVRREVGAIYFYAIAAECFAKSLLASTSNYRKKMPKIHDLVALLELYGVARQTIPIQLRRAAENHDVSIRYQKQVPTYLNDDELIRIRSLMSWIERRANRARLKSSRRSRT